MLESAPNYFGDQLSKSNALLILNALPSIGPMTCKRLLSAFSEDPRAIFLANKQRLMQVEGVGSVAADKIINWKKYFDLNKELSSMDDTGLRFCSIRDKSYPSMLKSTYDPPTGLYCLGNKELLQKPAIAIVGTRLASLYGKNQARKWASNLAKLGYCIVSGLARGIDFEAHVGALEVGGSSIAVLGHGLDSIYPPEHQELFQSLAKNGLLVSEFPLGRKANKTSFPMRNRITAGLSQGIIVVESGARGGSLITANFALDFGRSVFAIPGRLDAPQSQGCLELIKDGATILTSLKDVLNELEYFQSIQSIPFETKEPPKASLTEDEQLLFSMFVDGSRFTPSALAECLNVNISAVYTGLMQLELKHYIKKVMDGHYEINA
jgi:DNA processing protein